MAEGEVMEGFLCPTCMQKLNTPNQLLAHFEDQHKDEQDVLKSLLKDFLGKAKKKIGLRQDTEDEQFESSSYRVDIPKTYTAWEDQELGATRSHTAKLKMLRSSRLERYCAETNKLLIRLDKLLIDIPGDSSKRRAHEQNVVNWVEDTHVKLCPSCARGFHMTRRKHHCRLCGAIMCNDCSLFLAISDARRMTAATSLEEPGTVRRSGSTQSLNAGQSESDLRLCEPCHQLLSQREHLKVSRMSIPIISQFYNKLQSHREEATTLLPEYYKMYTSLCNGESLYHLSDAQYLRLKLLKLAELIDSMSKSILVMGTQSGESSKPQGRTLRLQQAIRSSATSFLRDQLIGLPNLPTEAELKQLQEKHKLGQVSFNNTPRAPQVLENASWVPANNSLPETDDIVALQMNILRNYIKQARDAHKYDEVRMLEANLREVQQEYWRQQNSSTGD